VLDRCSQVSVHIVPTEAQRFTSHPALVMLTVAAGISLTAMLEASKLSDKKIDTTKKGVQKHIDEVTDNSTHQPEQKFDV
jgi:hypothetical protein